ncbi:FimB/Mfa2 family fimbrial subunit [uncultured Bacteroides sp.]|uniref:FimB/Mfa2 family fimbrial subunit n=1 Tax=uncultured Bacteroides sp. TaxID=162156 RepID=UPI00260C4F16|nr:FimB/Mfa2 family fimbrial subunit [uncultured Bacteroides sp.]
MKRLNYIVWMLLLVPVLVTGCIKDDTDDCHNVTIYFQYLADGDKDVLYQYMDKVELYVFDEGGHILGVGTYNQDQLRNFSAVPSFKLKPGKRYKVVAVGNAYDHTQVVNLTSSTSFENIYIQSPYWGVPDPVINHDDNYMGQKEFVMPEGNFVMYRDTVTLYSSHVDVDIEITGLPAPQTRDEMPINVRFEHSNAQTSFNNEINLDEKGTCYPELIYDAERGCYRTDDFALFRMDNSGELHPDYCEHELVLSTADGTELIRGSIYNFITRNREYIDITKQEAYLPIEINFTPIEVTIKLPAWYVEDVEPDWQ